MKRLLLYHSRLFKLIFISFKAKNDLRHSLVSCICYIYQIIIQEKHLNESLSSLKITKKLFKCLKYEESDHYNCLYHFTFVIFIFYPIDFYALIGKIINLLHFREYSFRQLIWLHALPPTTSRSPPGGGTTPSKVRHKRKLDLTPSHQPQPTKSKQQPLWGKTKVGRT